MVLKILRLPTVENSSAGTSDGLGVSGLALWGAQGINTVRKFLTPPPQELTVSPEDLNLCSYYTGAGKGKLCVLSQGQ